MKQRKKVEKIFNITRVSALTEQMILQKFHLIYYYLERQYNIKLFHKLKNVAPETLQRLKILNLTTKQQESK